MAGLVLLVVTATGGASVGIPTGVGEQVADRTDVDTWLSALDFVVCNRHHSDTRESLQRQLWAGNREQSWVDLAIVVAVVVVVDCNLGFDFLGVGIVAAVEQGVLGGKTALDAQDYVDNTVLQTDKVGVHQHRQLGTLNSETGRE